jgi:hypothetical protein
MRDKKPNVDLLILTKLTLKLLRETKKTLNTRHFYRFLEFVFKSE